jgi:deazaflavin-dependent oxidoreductase (nitroreductase family)
MWRWIGIGAGGSIVLGLVLWLTLVIAMQTRFDPLMNAIRRMNRAVTNPRVMKRAGQPGAPAVIHHLGRKSATPYATPVGLASTEDGFVIGLPYGTSPDWLKNVIEAGSAVIESEGRSYGVQSPELVSMDDVRHYFSSGERLTFRLYGVNQVMRLHEVGAEVPNVARE